MALILNRRIFDALAEVTGFYGDEEHKPQREFLDAFFEGKRFCVNVWGRRAGKSLLMGQIGAYGALQSGLKIWIVSKTYSLAGKVWAFLLPALRSVMVEGRDFRVRTSDATIETKWGTTIILKSADHPDSLIGEGLDLLIIDEAATMKERIWLQYLEPTLLDKRGKCIFITTPRGHNWLFNLFELGNDANEPDYWASHATSMDNPYLPHDDFERIKRTTDPLVWRQEYLAEFVAFAHQVYSTFTRELHVIKSADLKEWSVSVTVDPGLANPTAMLWIAHNKTTGEDIVFREHIASGMLFPDVLRKVTEFKPAGGYDGLVCDVAGKARGQETGRSFFGWMNDHGMRFTARKVGIVDGVNRVRGRLLNVEGKVNMYVTENCQKTIQAFEGYHYPEREGEQKEEPQKDGVHDHAMDALRYYTAWRHAGQEARSWSA
jgi:hypothetical protein